MSKTGFRKAATLALWFLFCFMLGTGLLLEFRLVPGSQGGHGLTLFGMSRHQWGEYHLWAAYGFLAVLYVHLTLNFSFIKNVIAKKMRWPLFGLL